jgi:hypothetical protein
MLAMGEWQAMVSRLRGRVNHLAAFDPLRIAPLGTMRGTLTLASPLAQGAFSMSVTGGAGQAGATLLRGDWLQIGAGLAGQLVMVTADATANGSGVIAVSFENPIRLAAGYIAGTAVTWDRPLGHYKMVDSSSVLSSVDGGMLDGGAFVSLQEEW